MANNYKNSKVDLTTTNATVLYTAPSATTAIVRSILVSEDSGNADTLTMTLTAGTDVITKTTQTLLMVFTSNRLKLQISTQATYRICMAQHQCLFLNGSEQ